TPPTDRGGHPHTGQPVAWTGDHGWGDGTQRGRVRTLRYPLQTEGEQERRGTRRHPGGVREGRLRLRRTLQLLPADPCHPTAGQHPAADLVRRDQCTWCSPCCTAGRRTRHRPITADERSRTGA